MSESQKRCILEAIAKHLDWLADSNINAPVSIMIYKTPNGRFVVRTGISLTNNAFTDERIPTSEIF